MTKPTDEQVKELRVVLTPERVREEIKRVRLEIAHDLKKYELKYLMATEKP